MGASEILIVQRDWKRESKQVDGGRPEDLRIEVGGESARVKRIDFRSTSKLARFLGFREAVLVLSLTVNSEDLKPSLLRPKKKERSKRRLEKARWESVS